MTENKLCPHDRLTTAFCHPCEMQKILAWEAEYLTPSEKANLEEVCNHGLPLDGYCAFCEEEEHAKLKEYAKKEDERQKIFIDEHDGGSSSYYDLPEGATRIQDVIRDMTWNQANIFKAAYRWDVKPDLMYNLRKILWFCEDEIKYQQCQKNRSDAGNAKK